LKNTKEEALQSLEMKMAKHGASLVTSLLLPDIDRQYSSNKK